jgi:hypothetical protein
LPVADARARRPTLGFLFRDSLADCLEFFPRGRELQCFFVNPWRREKHVALPSR